MKRITTRIPKEMVERAEALADAGHYKNRSAVIRSALRSELARYDFSPAQPEPHPPQAPNNVDLQMPIEFSELRDALASRAKAASLMRALHDGQNGDSVVVFDEAGTLDGLPKPNNVTVAESRDEFKAVLNGGP